MGKNVLIIFEGAMCCSTGVCGPEPDKELIEFNEIIKKLQSTFNTLEIIRASLSFNVNMFLENKKVFQLVKEKGPTILPITTINREIIATQKYLKYDELKSAIEKS